MNETRIAELEKRIAALTAERDSLALVNLTLRNEPERYLEQWDITLGICARLQAQVEFLLQENKRLREPKYE